MQVQGTEGHRIVAHTQLVQEGGRGVSLFGPCADWDNARAHKHKTLPFLLVHVGSMFIHATWNPHDSVHVSCFCFQVKGALQVMHGGCTVAATKLGKADAPHPASCQVPCCSSPRFSNASTASGHHVQVPDATDAPAEAAATPTMTNNQLVLECKFAHACRSS